MLDDQDVAEVDLYFDTRHNFQDGNGVERDRADSDISAGVNDHDRSNNSQNDQMNIVGSTSTSASNQFVKNHNYMQNTN